MSVIHLSEESSTVITDLAPLPLLVLRQDRQILYANPAARALRLPHDQGSLAEPFDLGELLHCGDSEKPEGDVTARCHLYCSVNPNSRRKEPHSCTEECLITASMAGIDGSLEFSVRRRHVQWNGESAILIALDDVTHERRRRILERLFFHDILNTAGSVKGLSEILLMDRQNMSIGEQAEMLAMMRDSCGILVDEIRSQQVLLAAESGQLSMDWRQIAISDCIAETTMVGSHWQVASTKRLVPIYPAGTTMFTTDSALLGRVLINLLKNALEATPEGEEVRLAGRERGDAIEFSVWNVGSIPAALRPQIFHRSFSTKGTSRGTGLYSVRLITERYLKGQVSFTSNDQDGTTFTVVLPLNPPTQISCAS